jgi:hypothetical protein
MNTPPPPLAPLVDEAMHGLYHYFGNPNSSSAQQQQAGFNAADMSNGLLVDGASGPSTGLASSHNGYQHNFSINTGCNQHHTSLVINQQHAQSSHQFLISESMSSNQFNIEEKRLCNLICSFKKNTISICCD